MMEKASHDTGESFEVFLPLFMIIALLVSFSLPGQTIAADSLGPDDCIKCHRAVAEMVDGKGSKA